MSCGVGRRLSSDPELLWLRHRLAAVSLIGLLAWEPPYAAGVALKKKKKIGSDTNECDFFLLLFNDMTFNIIFLMSTFRRLA